MFGDVEAEISMGVPLEENACRGVIHGVDVELDEDVLIEGLREMRLRYILFIINIHVK